jgi:16S rRNA (guanine(966)-N(2))-methyltransferase RsmD
MVREAVFNVLGPVAGLKVLDLFAGTGALGLEALSRGASSCVFAEADRSVAAVLQANIERLRFEDRGRVIVGDYRQALERLLRSGACFDLLFVDPPYRMLAEVEVTLTPLLTDLLSPVGVAVIEGERSLGVAFGRNPVFDRVYGDTRITIIRAKE